ncbi:MAG: potassium-transporting ATPase subunit KdpA [Blastocatellia bacterium]|nr:potassium-transporting ATPase subunit KdpA [Blastocatellia bacterium]
MTFNGLLQFLFYFLLLLLLTKPLGIYMAKVYSSELKFLSPVERLFYKLCRIDEKEEQKWTTYTVAMLLFNLVGMIFLYLLQSFQQYLPLNPQSMPRVAPDLAFNTATSFITNTNWQAYSGESTMSYLVQMSGLAVQNFLSAATGLALAVAFIRGIARREVETLGNFWVDMTRSVLYILLPLCIVGALFLVSQGVVQNLKPYTTVRLIEPQQMEDRQTEVISTQTIAQGPVASQEIIKQLGTNGGGFFNANSAHPFENPTPLSNFIEMLAILLIPAALTYTLGKMTENQKHGWALFATMSILFIVGFFTVYYFESQPHPLLSQHNVSQTSVEGGQAAQAGGNMEGKEVRFGIANSALFATATTDASCGAVNSMHDSYSPIGGMVLLLNIMLGEIIFGGVGAGLYGMLVMVLLTVFIAGLMVGRTPEYLGKKIEAKEIKMAMLYTLVFAVIILVFSSWSSVAEFSASKVNNGGPHGLSEIVYAFTSATGNNGSAFAGVTVNTLWYNITLALSMLIGRFLMIIPMMAIAGSLASKKYIPPSSGTFPVHTPLFVLLLISIILIVGALTFFPVLSLGPIIEHFLVQNGLLF